MSIEKDIKGLQIIANQRCMCTPEQQTGDDPSTCIVCMASSILNNVAEQLHNDIQELNKVVDKQVEDQIRDQGVPIPKAPTGDIEELKGIPSKNNPKGAYSDIESQSTFMVLDQED